MEIRALHEPNIEEVLGVIQGGLQKNFEHFEIQVVPCVDLTGDDWKLTAPGLCGNPILADVGEGANLIDPALNSKTFSFKQILE